MELLAVEDESARFNRRSILRSEKIYGTGFQSPGGLILMDAFCRRLPMRRGMSILDIGSGLGGAAFYFAERYGASVIGVDVAPAMIEISSERLAQNGLSDIRFIGADIRGADLPAGSFDLAWSRDCILYISDKVPVWRAIVRSLRPGGYLFITDFCCTPGTISLEFAEYLHRCHYHLQDIQCYAEAIAGAGLNVLTQEDITSLFVVYLNEEKQRLERSREIFLTEFDERDYAYLIGRWDNKLAFCRSGDLRWGLFIARKPSET